MRITTGSGQPRAAFGEAPEDALSETGRRILFAARRIIASRGLRYLTFASVAEESGENQASIAYHFGNKAGLIEACVDSLIHHGLASTEEGFKRGQEADKTDGVLENAVMPIVLAASWMEYWEVMPYILRSERLREDYALWYRRFRQSSAKWLEGIHAAPESDIGGIAALAVAAMDGLGIQLLLEPGCPEALDAIRVLEKMIGLLREQG